MKLRTLSLVLVAAACAPPNEPPPPNACITNACGGCASLSAAPGDACGNTGTLRCETPDTLVCDELNVLPTQPPPDLPTVGCEPWVVGGRVVAMEPAGHLLYIGGSFNYVGPRTGSMAMLDPASGARVAMPARVEGGPTMAIVRDGAGGYFIGGAFAKVGDVRQRSLARIDAAGDLDLRFRPSIEGAVESIALHGHTLYAAGDFGLARVDADETSPTYGSVDLWSSDPVHSIAVQGNRLLVAGEFSAIRNQPRRGFAAIDLVSGTVLSWIPDLPAPDTVERVIAASDRVFVALRDPSPVDPKVRAAEIRDPQIGQPIVTVFELGVIGQVFAFALDQGEEMLFVGGQLSPPSPGLDSNLVAVDVDRSSPTFGELLPVGRNLRGELDGTGKAITALAATKDTLYVGGWFTEIGGVHRHRLAALDIRRGSSYGDVLPFDPGTDGAAAVILIDEAHLVIGGRLESAGGVRRTDLAALDMTPQKPSCGAPTPFAPEIRQAPIYYHHAVEALRVYGDRIFVGGDFGRAKGAHGMHRRCGAAAFHIDPSSPSFGLVDEAWDPNIRIDPGPGDEGCGGSVVSMVIDPVSDAIYMAGPFSHASGDQRPGLVRVNSYDGLPDAWIPGPSGSRFARKLLIEGRTLIVAGDQDWLAGSSRVVAVDLSTGAPDPRIDADAINPHADPVVVGMSGGRRILLAAAGELGGVIALDLTPGSASFGSVLRASPSYSTEPWVGTGLLSIVAAGDRLFTSALANLNGTGDVLASLDGDPDSPTFGLMRPVETPLLERIGTMTIVEGRVYGTADVDVADLPHPMGLGLSDFLQPVRLWPLR